jgi:hypothetical protein
VSQAIGLAVEIFGMAAIVALAVAIGTAFGGSRLLRSGGKSHFVLPLAVVIGYFAGYLLLPRSFAALTPQANQPWQWLPWLAAITVVLSASLSPWSRPSAWSLPLVVAACIAGAALAPGWPVFGLTRRPLQLVLALYLVFLGIPLLYLPRQAQKRWLVTALAVAGMVNATAIGALVSTRLAKMAAMSAAVFTAAAIAGLWLMQASDRSLRNLICVYAILTGSIAWLAFVEPDPPQPLLLVAPLVPLILWLEPVVRLPFVRGKIG